DATAAKNHTLESDRSFLSGPAGGSGSTQCLSPARVKHQVPTTTATSVPMLIAVYCSSGQRDIHLSGAHAVTCVKRHSARSQSPTPGCLTCKAANPMRKV